MTPRSSNATSPMVTVRFGKTDDELPPDHQPNQVGPAHVRTRHGGDRLAIAKHRDAIGDGDNLLEPMRDVDDARAAAAQPLDDPEQLLRLALGERRRRFVHDQDLRVRAERLGDLHHLLLGHAERLDQAIGIDRRADPRQEIRRQACARPPVHASPRVAALERQRDVLGDGEVGEERGLLVDGRDPQGPRDRGRHVGHGLTRHDERPRVGATAPVITLISVLLPAPFSPTSACTSPAWRSNDTPCKARTPSYDLVIDPALSRSRGSVGTVARCYRTGQTSGSDPGLTPLISHARRDLAGSDLGLTPPACSACGFAREIRAFAQCFDAHWNRAGV